MRFRPYPEYTPTGIEWLGDVPSHWEVKRLRYLLRCLDQGWSPVAASWPASDGEWGVLKLSAARHGMFIPSENKALDNEIDDNDMITPRAGDLLISRSNTPDRVGDVAFVLVAQPRLLIPDLLYRAELNSSSALPAFVCMFLLSRVARAQIEADARGSSGSMVKLGQSHVRAWFIACPPCDEQRIIVDFLDSETTKIDTLVAKKRTLIERLKEKRAALISHIVTRGLPPDAARAAGLDPHPKLKPSGVDWLGDVPEHWNVTPLGRLVHFSGGATPDKATPEFWDGDIPWVSPKDMKRFRINDVPDHISEDALNNSPLALLPARSVLIVVRGMILAHSFPVAITDAPVTINQDMKALAAGKNLEPEFLLWLLSGVGRVFVSLADESAHGTRKLESEVVARVLLPTPPEPEQLVIVDFLNRETAKIDAMTSKVEAAVQRLQEYRTALITAAVTGKIDVRGTIA